MHTSAVTPLAGRLYCLAAAWRLHMALHPAFSLLRPFPGKIRHFPSSTAKVVFFLAAHVRCHCSCWTIALAMRGLLFPHGCAPRLLSLQAHANISRKQWAFHKFPGKSRLFHCCTRRQSLFLPGDCIASRRPAACTWLCTPPSRLAPISGQRFGHFPSSTAKVVFFLAAHVRCHCSCWTIALAMRGLLFAHGRAPRILSLQAHANISRKQWAFHKFPAKSRLFPCCTRPLSLSLLNDSTGCRRTAACACACTPPSPLAPISGNHWAFTMFHGKSRLFPCCTRPL